MLPLDPTVGDEIALGAAAGAAIALLASIAAHVRLRRLRRGFAAFDGDGKTTVLDALRHNVDETASLRAEVTQARNHVDAVRRDLGDALRHVAVLRYDAFGDMGGRLSFTAALLDDAGDGVVFTSIHGRSEGRTYAKGIKAGASEQSLSPEEQQAIELALGQRGPAGDKAQRGSGGS